MLSTISLIGLAALVSHLFKCRMETSIFLAAAAVIVLLFLGGSLNILSFTAWVLWMTGFAGGAAVVYRTKARSLSSPGTIAFILAAILLYLKVQPSAFARWDEFSHWGTVIKHYASVGSLYQSSTLYFPDYPPGLALFSYFIFLPFDFSEAMSLYASGLLVLSVLAAVSAGAGIAGTLLIFSIGTGLSFIFGAGIDTVLIDYTLGVMFAATIVVYLSTISNGIIRASAFAGIAVFSLVLLKAAGLGLALTAILAMAAASFSIQATWSKKALAFSMLIGAALLPTALWRTVMYVADYPSRLTNFSLITPLRELLFPSSETAAQIVSAFGNAVIGGVAFEQTGIGLPNALAFILALLVVASANSASWIDFKRRTTISLWLSTGLIVYLYGILATYLTNMSTGEATALASFDRYASVYLAGLATVAVFLNFQPSNSRLASLSVGVISLLITSQIAPPRMMEFVKFGSPPLTSHRQEIKDFIEPFLDRITPQDRVYILWQETSGYEYWILRFEMLPSRVNPGCWWVSTDLQPGAPVQECQKSVEELATELMQYDYLLVARSNNRFLEDYGPSLGVTADGLYQITVEDKSLKLTPSETSGSPESVLSPN